MEMTTQWVQYLFLITWAICVPQNAIKILENTAKYDDNGDVYSFDVDVTHDDGTTQFNIYKNQIREKEMWS